VANDTTDSSKYVAIFVSLLALGYTAWKDRKMGKRMKAVEQVQELEKQEAAIRHSKASAPYFSPSKQIFGHVYETKDDGGLVAWSSMNENVLSIHRKIIANTVPENTPVIIVLDTGGKGARRIRISGDMPNIELKQEPNIDSAHGLIFLKYPYSPTQQGQKQKVIFSFETEDGLDLTHTYETRHGHFEFYRIDPK
jgi:hypothetical protein